MVSKYISLGLKIIPIGLILSYARTPLFVFRCWISKGFNKKNTTELIIEKLISSGKMTRTSEDTYHFFDCNKVEIMPVLKWSTLIKVIIFSVLSKTNNGINMTGSHVKITHDK